MRLRMLALVVSVAAASPLQAQTPPSSQPSPAALEELIRSLLGASGAGVPSVAGSLPEGLSLPPGMDAGGLEGLLGGKKEGGPDRKALPALGQPVDGPFSRPGGQATQAFRRDDYVSGNPTGNPLSRNASGTSPLVEAARAAARQRCTKEPDEAKRAACLAEAEKK